MALNQNVDILFFGDSITAAGPWSQLLNNPAILNWGIDGDTTRNLLSRVDQLFPLNLSKLFLMIGINDLYQRVPVSIIESNLLQLFALFDKKLPNTRIYIQSTLPVDMRMLGRAVNNEDVRALNEWLKHEATQRGYAYIDLVPHFSDGNGSLLAEFTRDGVHLLPSAYKVWASAIEDDVNE